MKINFMHVGPCRTVVAVIAFLIACVLPVAAQKSLTADDLYKMLQNSAPAAKSRAKTLLQDDLKRLLQNRVIVNTAARKAQSGKSFRVEERRRLAAISTQPGYGSVSLEIYFDYDSAAIRPRAAADLARLGQALVRLPGSTFMVAGHTDARGSAGYNLKLSRRRARAIRDFLLSAFDLDRRKLIAVGYGEEQPKIRSNPEAAQNRRVQIVNLSR